MRAKRRLLITLPLSLLAACDVPVDEPPATVPVPASVTVDKKGPPPPDMQLATPPLATVFTGAGTRVDFLEPVPGEGILVTESGPANVEEVSLPLARAQSNDLMAAYRAIDPEGVIPQALIDAVERNKQRVAERPLRTPLSDVDQVRAPESELLPPSVESRTSAVTTGTEGGNGCKSTTVDFECNYNDSWSVCLKNQFSDHWFTRVDNESVREKICVFTSQYVQWQVKVRPWYDWTTFGDFTVTSGKWRRIWAWSDNIINDFDYHSNVFNVVPDGYHRGASGYR
jgi:hypothetical protein